MLVDEQRRGGQQKRAAEASPEMGDDECRRPEKKDRAHQAHTGDSLGSGSTKEEGEREEAC